MKLQNYTLRYLALTLLAVIPIWAGIFYVLILEEVYDSIDDDLQNSKIIIIRQAFIDKNLLNTPEFGINKFTIKPLPRGSYSLEDEIYTIKELVEYDNDLEPMRTLQTVFKDENGNYYQLIIKASIVEEAELLTNLLLALVGLYFMLVISILAVNRLLLKKVWKSFYNILKDLKQVKLGNENKVRPVKTTIDEFTILAQEIEKMLNRNEKTYASQKHFIENVSHELQTPLAISINKLELFAESSLLSDEQMIEIGKITDTLSRLTRLNKSLLMLSRIENQQFSEEKIVDFQALFALLIQDYSDFVDFKKVKIETTTQIPLFFKMNKGLAFALLSNLLKNAIIHNHLNGYIRVIIKERQIVICNSGSSTPLNQAEIYNRFYRDTATNDSTGLGLSIVKSIIANYGISIDYSYTNEHQFEITFPK